MLVAKNMLSLVVELGLVALCRVSDSHAVEMRVLIHVCPFWLVKIIQNVVSPS